MEGEVREEWVELMNGDMVDLDGRGGGDGDGVERWAGVGHAQKALGIKQTGLCGIARMRLG